MNDSVRLPLTQKQKQVLQYIVDFFSEHRYPPTYNEIGHALNYKSPGHAYAVVKALESKGYLKIISSNNRSIRLTELSEGMPTSKQLDLFTDNMNDVEKGDGSQ
jgi:SOS-response transcriptional repressor LexA